MEEEDTMEKKEILVVISKLKKYIRSASGMNTAGAVAPAISDIIRQMCNEAIEKAKADGRKTVMDRDFL
jgi:histone H3/H4